VPPAQVATIEGVPQIHHLSQATYDRLALELEELTTVGRTEIARKIQAARELGDLKENGDYHAAKEEQGKMEARISHLSGMIENSEIMEGGASDEVRAGSIVTLAYDGEDDDPEKCLIGSIEERDSSVDMVTSPTSPLGSSLMGKRAGDVVEFQAPSGIQRVTVVDIS